MSKRDKEKKVERTLFDVNIGKSMKEITSSNNNKEETKLLCEKNKLFIIFWGKKYNILELLKSYINNDNLKWKMILFREWENNMCFHEWVYSWRHNWELDKNQIWIQYNYTSNIDEKIYSICHELWHLICEKFDNKTHIDKVNKEKALDLIRSHCQDIENKYENEWKKINLEFYNLDGMLNNINKFNFIKDIKNENTKRELMKKLLDLDIEIYKDTIKRETNAREKWDELINVLINKWLSIEASKLYRESCINSYQSWLNMVLRKMVPHL